MKIKDKEAVLNVAYLKKKQVSSGEYVAYLKKNKCRLLIKIKDK